MCSRLDPIAVLTIIKIGNRRLSRMKNAFDVKLSGLRKKLL